MSVDGYPIDPKNVEATIRTSKKQPSNIIELRSLLVSLGGQYQTLAS